MFALLKPITAALIFTLAGSSVIWAANTQDCKMDGPPDQTISGCTLVIQANEHPPQTMAYAYLFRGRAFVARKELDSALKDFKEALRIDNPGIRDALQANIALLAANHPDTPVGREALEVIRSIKVK